MARTRTSNPATVEVTLQSAYQSSFGDIALAMSSISLIAGIILYSLR